MRSVLVTGGAGFIGSFLVEKLIQDGHQVVVVDNQSSSYGGKNLLKVKNSQNLFFYREDVRNTERIADVMKKHRVDACVHLAAKFNVAASVSNPQETISVNVDGTSAVLKACARNNVGISIFGAVPGQQVSIQSSFRNFQQVDQNYAIIIQVVDQNGFTQDVSWVEGTLPSGETAESSRSWTAGTSGSYTIRILVWDGVSATPTPLSEITTRSFTVS